MAALNYIQFYPADYLADTAHLTTEEHGAYFLLILNYWQTGKKLRIDRLPIIARMPNDRWISVADVLGEFFNEVDGYWIHDRIEADLQTVNDSIQQKIEAGKASARQRAAKNQRKGNDRSNDRSNGKGNEEPTERQLLDKIRLDNIHSVFSHWQKTMSADNIRLTSSRRDKIGTRLQNYSPEQIQQAIDNCSRSEYHMGKNPQNAKYNDISLICRSDEKIDFFLAMAGQPEQFRGLEL